MSTSSASTLSIAEFDTLGKQDFGNCDVGNSAALSMRFDGPEPSAMTETLNDPMTQSCTSPATQSLDGSIINLIRGSGGAGSVWSVKMFPPGPKFYHQAGQSRPSASALNLSSFVQPFSSSELNPAGLRCV